MKDVSESVSCHCHWASAGEYSLSMVVRQSQASLEVTDELAEAAWRGVLFDPISTLIMR